MSNLSLKVTLQAIDKMTGPLRGISRQSQRLSQGYKADMRGYNDTIRQTEQALKGVRDAQRRMGQAGQPLTRASIEAEQALVRRINETNAALERRKTLMDREMDAIRRRQAAMDRGKQQMKSGSMKLASAAAASYAGIKFMQPAFEFNEKMSNVRAITQLDKNDVLFQKLREQADHLGATTWATASQAADAQAFYAMAGYSPEAIMKVLPATLNLAKASGVELDRTADIISNILSGFGLDPEETEDVADILTTAFTGANTSLEKLGGTMEYVAPAAEALKVPLEEAAAMAGILGNIGIQDSKAGTAMRKIYTSLASPNATGVKALKQLNIATKDASGNLRAVPDIFAEVLNKTKKMGNADRMGILTDIVGLEAATAFSALVNEKNTKDFDVMMEKMAERHGITQNTADIMSDNLMADWTNFTSAITGVQIAIGDLNEGPLRTLLQNITKVIQKGTAWIKENPKMVKMISVVAAGFIGLTAVLGSLAIMMGIVNIVFLANPVTWIILGIVAALVALGAAITAVVVYKEEIYDFFKAFSQSPGEHIKKAIDWVTKLIDTIGTFLGEIPYVGPAFKLAFNMAVWPIRFVSFLIGKIIDTFKWVRDHKTEIGDWFSAAWVSMLDAMQPVFDLFNAILNVVKNLIEKVQELFDLHAPDWLKASLEMAGNTWDSATGYVGNKIDRLFGNDVPLENVNHLTLTPAEPVRTTNNTSNYNDIKVNVSAMSNASPQAIGAAVANAVGSSLLGDEY